MRKVEDAWPKDADRASRTRKGERMTEILEGGCLCRAIRYRAEADETLHYLCHCTDCQRYGGGAYHAAVIVAAAALEVFGAPQVHARQGDSGRTVARHFCGACGGHLFTSPWPEATRFSIKAGTLDDPARFRPAHEIWRQSRLDWASPPEMERFEQGFLDPIAIGARPAAPEPGEA
jgi:hypothetical protein